MSASPAQLEIRRVAYGQPDAMRLIAAVQAEYVQRYGGPDDTPLDHAMFEPPLGSFYVAYADGEPVATGAWRRTPVRALEATDAAEIKRMYVVPSARGAGVARAVLAHLEATAVAAGIDTLLLETGMKQPEAIALYTSSGYVPVPGFGYYKDQPLSRCFGRRLVPAEHI